MQEFSIIENFFKPLTNNQEAARGLIDDAAKFSLEPNQELIISKDLFTEDVHFLASDSPFKIASKLLRTNLSDLAASGATPLYYMLGFSKNSKLDQNFYQEFARGLKSVQDEFDISLIGGDTISSKTLTFSITIFGTVKKGEILSRTAAQNNDLIFVSGFIGDAFLGLKLENQTSEYFSNQLFFPQPRISLGQALLSEKLSKCAIDISDGLLADLKHLCQASHLEANINLEQIPISASAKKILAENKNFTILDLISGGDDYELIFSAPKEKQDKIFALAKKLNLNITRIGSFKKPDSENYEVNLFDQHNQKITIKKFGYEH